MDAQAALMGSRSLLTDWAEHQASDRSGDQATVSNGSALCFASRCLMSFEYLCDAAARGPNWIRHKLFENAAAFSFLQKELITLGGFKSFLKDHQTS